MLLEGDGSITVIEVSPSAFSPIATCKLPTNNWWTPPAFYDGKLYCRNYAGCVVCLDVGGEVEVC